MSRIEIGRFNERHDIEHQLSERKDQFKWETLRLSAFGEVRDISNALLATGMKEHNIYQLQEDGVVELCRMAPGSYSVFYLDKVKT